ncbi:unnamed protein product [Urochloa humidicola]
MLVQGADDTAYNRQCGRQRRSELTTLLCTQCPCLRSLHISGRLVASPSVSIVSESLHSLTYRVPNTKYLEVVAPRLEELTLSVFTDETRIIISAPKLGKLSWHGTYDPCYHQFSDVARHLLLLEIGQFYQLVPSLLIRQFDEVDVLELDLFILGVVGYQSFLGNIKNLSKCKALRVTLSGDHHGLAPVILHRLFRSCSSMRKFSLTLVYDKEDHFCPSSCPCYFEDSRRIDNFDLGSLFF